MMFSVRLWTRIPRNAAYARARLPLFSLLTLLAICACGSISYHGIGAVPLPVTHLPATKLRLAIRISGQFGDQSDKPNVYGRIVLLDGTTGAAVTIPDNALLTCNGSEVEQSVDGRMYFGCPRQPPGGSYRFTFTDERGAKTTVSVPVPTGAFALFSPRPGSAVPIPTNGELTLRYSVPTPPADGSVEIGLISAWCRISEAEPCGHNGVSVDLNPYATPTPAGPMLATPTEFRGLPTPTPSGPPAPTPTINRGAATPTPSGLATPKPGDTPPPTPGYGAGSRSTATVTQHGGLVTIVLAGDYRGYQPSKIGGISLYIQEHVAPDRGDFLAADAVFAESLTAPITWTR